MGQGALVSDDNHAPNGEVVTIAGTDEGGANVTIPESERAQLAQLTTASLSLPYYPRSFVAPDAGVFYAGEDQQSRYSQRLGHLALDERPARKFRTRDYRVCGDV